MLSCHNKEQEEQAGKQLGVLRPWRKRRKRRKRRRRIRRRKKKRMKKVKCGGRMWRKRKNIEGGEGG